MVHASDKPCLPQHISRTSQKQPTCPILYPKMSAQLKKICSHDCHNFLAFFTKKFACKGGQCCREHIPTFYPPSVINIKSKLMDTPSASN